MSNTCQLTGKKGGTGNNRSHSMRATRRTFKANITKKMVVDPVTGKKVRVKLSTRALRTMAKNPTKFSKQLAKLAK